MLTPVTLPPGRLRLCTIPILTGSPPVANTIGIVPVAAFAVSAADVSASVAMTLTLCWTRSAANSGSRENWPLAQRYSIRKLSPSDQPGIPQAFEKSGDTLGIRLG